MTITHTVVDLEVSSGTFEEIRKKLVAAGYAELGAVRLPMDGLSLVKEPKKGPDPVPRSVRIACLNDTATDQLFVSLANMLDNSIWALLATCRDERLNHRYTANVGAIFWDVEQACRAVLLSRWLKGEKD